MYEDILLENQIPSPDIVKFENPKPNLSTPPSYVHIQRKYHRLSRLLISAVIEAKGIELNSRTKISAIVNRR